MNKAQDKINVGKQYDRRYKITDEERNKIKLLYEEQKISIRGIERYFQNRISRRSIQFILFPERKLKVQERAKEVKRWKNGNNKILHTPAVRRHRRYKRMLIKKKLIGLQSE